MSGSVVFRWLVPAALAALLAIPIQTAEGSRMGGGGGGMGGGHMGGMGRGGFGGRGTMGGRPAMSSRFFSHNGTSFNHNGMNHFASRQNLASRNHDPGRFNNRGDRSLDRRDQFRDRHGLPDRGIDRADRFRDNHFGRFDRDDRFGRFGRFDRDDRRFFFGHNFFVGFNFGAFGWWPGWWGWGWGGPWWWGWDGWAYPYPYCDYGYPYGYSYDDPPASDSQYGSKEYWSDLAMSVQTKLTNDGYYHGQIDGVLNSDSLEAIRQFQADHGLSVSGKIDPKLLDALGIQHSQQNEQNAS
jgi:putative peptidoglycan binding protein